MNTISYKLLNYHPNAIVVQDNAFIELPRHLGVQDQKLFLFIVSAINPQETIQSHTNSVLRIYVREYAKAIQLKSLTDAYRDVRKCIDNLQEKVLTITALKNNKPVHISISILSYACYYKNEGYVDIKLNPEILPFLAELKSHFTKYKLEYIANLSSVYAIRLYELLKKLETVGNRTFDLLELRKALDINDSKFQFFKDFRVKVLEIAKREINQKTDISIDFSMIKTGRKVTHIQFIINNKKQKSLKEPSLELFTPNIVRTKLNSYGVSDNEIINLVHNYPIDRIETAIRVVDEQIHAGKVKNTNALFKKALSNNWIPNKSKYYKSPKSNHISNQSAQNFSCKSTTRANKTLSLGECLEIYNILPDSN